MQCTDKYVFILLSNRSVEWRREFYKFKKHYAINFRSRLRYKNAVMYHLGVTRGRLLTEIGNRLNIDFLSASALHIRDAFIKSYQLNCQLHSWPLEGRVLLLIQFNVLLQLLNSSEIQVTLQSVQLTTSGLYRCEVSGEAPSFQTVTEHGKMIVVGKFLHPSYLTVIHIQNAHIIIAKTM